MEGRPIPEKRCHYHVGHELKRGKPMKLRTGYTDTFRIRRVVLICPASGCHYVAAEDKYIAHMRTGGA